MCGKDGEDYTITSQCLYQCDIKKNNGAFATITVYLVVRGKLRPQSRHVSYVCTYARMHVCTYACMHVCVYACMHVCMYACMHVCIYAFMHLCIYAFIHVCIYAFMHLCIYAFMHLCIYACMHVSCMRLVIIVIQHNNLVCPQTVFVITL